VIRINLFCSNHDGLLLKKEDPELVAQILPVHGGATTYLDNGTLSSDLEHLTLSELAIS